MINQRSQDFRSVKQVINKDAIFSEIQSILQCLQSIVSKLSESDSIPVPVCPEVPEVQDQLDMWWDSQDVQCPLSFIDDDNNAEEDIISIGSIMEDKQLFSDHSSSCSDDYQGIADRVKLRHSSLIHHHNSSDVNAQWNSGDDADVSSFSPQCNVNDDPFINKLSKVIQIISPNFVFNLKKSKKRRMRRINKKIHPALIKVWRHSGDLFNSDISKSESLIPVVPLVNWEKVNQRFINNIPTPSPQPKHGVSNYPPFYKETKYHSQADYKEGLFHLSKAPFGSELGYLTSAGVISHASNTNIIHGYVWSDSFQKYILHADFPSKRKKEVESSKRRKSRRWCPAG